MCAETEGYSLKILKGVDHHFTARDSAPTDTAPLVISDNILHSTPSSVGALMEFRSAASTGKKIEKGLRHRRHRNGKSKDGNRHWEMVAGMSSSVIAQLDQEILLLGKIIESYGISIPSSSLLHPSHHQQKHDALPKPSSTSGDDNLNCCPSYQATFKATVGTDVNGEAVYLAGYNQHDDTLVQTFHAIRCFPHVVNKPCRFINHQDGAQTAAMCVQKFSFTPALTSDYENGGDVDDDDAGVQNNATQIRVPSGCQCEIPI